MYWRTEGYNVLFFSSRMGWFKNRDTVSSGVPVIQQYVHNIVDIIDTRNLILIE